MSSLARVLPSLAAILAALLTLSGCGGSRAAGSFTNPVYKADFPDPYVLKVGKTYYAYSTNSPQGGNTPTIKSTDLVHWTKVGESFPITPRWLDRDIWAPTVIGLKNGSYILVYSGHSQDLGHECLGLAHGKSPTGPFIDRSLKPFFCQNSWGGDIDPDLYRDSDGTLYLYWKNDGNCCGQPTYLWGAKLAQDGSRLLTAPVKLTYNDQGWESDVTEAPFMWKHDKTYYLFYSGNHWDSPEYAIGDSSCTGPLGPCKDNPNNPIMQVRFDKACEVQGPGGEAVVTDAGGQDWLVYHAWPGENVGYDQGAVRALYIDPLNWKNGTPVVGKPTCKTSPAPAT